MPEAGGIRCAYHAWKFERRALPRSAGGTCRQHDEESNPHRRLSGARNGRLALGLSGAGAGAASAALRAHGARRLDRDVGISRMPCNWLQIAENTMDPLHIEYLHMRYTNYVSKRKGLPPVQIRTIKRSTSNSSSTASSRGACGKATPRFGRMDDRSSAALPGPRHGRVQRNEWVQYQIRVPADDTNTTHYWLNCRRREAGKPPHAEARFGKTRGDAGVNTSRKSSTRKT